MDKKDGRTYWNARARTFPRYEEGDQTYEAGMLRRPETTAWSLPTRTCWMWARAAACTPCVWRRRRRR